MSHKVKYQLHKKHVIVHGSVDRERTNLVWKGLWHIFTLIDKSVRMILSFLRDVCDSKHTLKHEIWKTALENKVPSIYFYQLSNNLSQKWKLNFVYWLFLQNTNICIYVYLYVTNMHVIHSPKKFDAYMYSSHSYSVYLSRNAQQWSK